MKLLAARLLPWMSNTCRKQHGLVIWLLILLVILVRSSRQLPIMGSDLASILYYSWCPFDKKKSRFHPLPPKPKYQVKPSANRTNTLTRMHVRVHSLRSSTYMVCNTTHIERTLASFCSILHYIRNSFLQSCNHWNWSSQAAWTFKICNFQWYSDRNDCDNVAKQVCNSSC